jgi:hypothetical protein
MAGWFGLAASSDMQRAAPAQAIGFTSMLSAESIKFLTHHDAFRAFSAHGAKPLAKPHAF